MAGEKATKPAEIGEVPAHWEVGQLSVFTSRITYGFTNPMPTTDEGPFMLTAKDVNGGRIVYENARRTSWEAFRNELTDKSRPRVGDVLLTKDGSIGRVALCDRPDVCINQSVALLQPNERIEPRFLKFLLEVPHYQQRMEGDADGTTIKHIYITRVDKMQVAVPPIAEQKAIAAVLGTLDDKIELNRRMNATLEAMARALFQSWFVDFDPVRAKLDGREPTGLDPATAALFPERLEDSLLGHIPKGWEVKAVGDIGGVICGKTPPTSVSDYYGDDIPFITIPDMHGNVFGAATARKLSHAGANSQANKTLPPGSLCVSCIATPGLVVITSEDSQTNQQINSVVPHQKEETYFWYWVMTGLGAEIASSGSGGSVLVNLSKGRFETLQVIKPLHALIRAYHTTVRPLFETILANTHQSRTLATLRDTLLPKLLSGKLSASQTPL